MTYQRALEIINQADEVPIWGYALDDTGWYLFIMLITAAVGWIILTTHEKPITADASTDTTEQIPPQVENLNQEELPK